jgi:two-component system C4-dicarboxylate transport response regulator DctD
MARLRILIVDDDALTVRLLCELVIRYFRDVQVDGTACPRTALEYAKTTEYSAVLTDFVMPGINGLQLAAGIHAMQPTVPILMISGSLEVLEHSHPPIFTLLRKPLDIEAILGALRSALHDGPPHAQVGEKTRHISTSSV